MSNNLPVSVDDLVGAIAKTTTILKKVAGGSSGTYLKMIKGGFWVYGSDETEVEEGSKWAVNPNSFQLGYICWMVKGSGAPLGEQMASIVEAPVVEATLPAMDNGRWTQQVAMQLMCISGEDKGTQVEFKGSTHGALSGFNDFLNRVMEHLQADQSKPVPVISLSSSSYKHAEYGKIHTPVFEINDWSTIDSMPEVEAEPEAEEKVAEVKEKAAPKRRRRRAAA